MTLEDSSEGEKNVPIRLFLISQLLILLVFPVIEHMHVFLLSKAVSHISKGASLSVLWRQAIWEKGFFPGRDTRPATSQSVRGRLHGLERYVNPVQVLDIAYLLGYIINLQ